VKLVIVACNTASAAALGSLQAAFAVPVLGVIEPGVRSLVAATRTGRVGVIGTVGTIASGAYQRAVAGTGAGVELTCAACPGFVEFVERDDIGGDQVHVLAERLLAPVVEAKVDTLLLGCTHYPYLARTIADVVGRDVVLVSSADETAFEVRSALLGHGADNEGGGGVGRRATGAGPARHRFLSSGDVEWFRRLGSRLLGPELDIVERTPWA
jgi:glutamate racemase